MSAALRAAIPLTCSAALALGATGVACLDTTPFFVAPDASPPAADADLDAGAEEAGDAAVDVDPRPPCQRCIETPDDAGYGCGAELAPCLADVKCADVYACILANECITRARSLREVILCGLPCASEAGVTQVDPAAQLIYNVAQCAETNCTATCAPYLLDGGGD